MTQLIRLQNYTIIRHFHKKTYSLSIFSLKNSFLAYSIRFFIYSSNEWIFSYIYIWKNKLHKIINLKNPDTNLQLTTDFIALTKSSY